MTDTTISTPASADAATKPARKLFIRTFGCQMNEYDSEKMADILNQDRPVELTTNPEEADIILFNTCSV
ncbi:MAG TPA: tRNA (N6-isopentenyl adenosine(37)-C2)-methylthiotransferase MiaB, partial [Alcaligenes faecalis]|nr:tRNA (N6-isopentenyl adenosine(37)-C2)-methylthiotransferase MiaB [Alcaligenes faecalis]